jgi:NADPH-dependent curcumin reductase CurA
MPGTRPGMTREIAVSANRQILLAETPKGKLGPEHFKLQEGAMPSPQDGEVLLKVRLISLDAANRAWMQGATYREAVGAGTVMAGGSISEVVESKDPKFSKGDLVFADTGWQEYAALSGRKLLKVPNMKPMTHLLSVYGVAGLTAYFGLLDVGQPKAGETVVVSAAAGSVGSLVGQIAKIKGCRVVGIAGGKEKCDWLKSELGFDEAIDYKSGPVFKALKAACPDGIDVYFDNVGGVHLDAAFALARKDARFAICGMIEGYNAAEPMCFRFIMRVIAMRIRVQGFIYTDYMPRMSEFHRDMGGWIASGQVKARDTVVEGLEKTPEAFLGLFEGANTGKMLVKL